MSRKHISKSDIKRLNEQISYLGYEISKKSKVEVVDDEVVVVDSKPYFFYYKKRVAPTLHFILEHPDSVSKLVVDMGAVKFVVGGADVMRPGVVTCDDFIEDDLVVVVDENHGKPLALAVALFDSDSLMAQDSGKVVKSIHRIGDEVWDKK
ncbi:hypothetical protein BVX95_00570 [archaeon D22]|nr:hypothetical protein BVX95_00570 [archaeon D22]